MTLLMRLLLAFIPDGKSAPQTGDLGKEHDWYLGTLADLLQMLAQGTIKPVVAERIPLLEAARAHSVLERGEYGGKVVLVAGQEIH